MTKFEGFERQGQKQVVKSPGFSTSRLYISKTARWSLGQWSQLITNRNSFLGIWLLEKVDSEWTWTVATVGSCHLRLLCTCIREFICFHLATYLELVITLGTLWLASYAVMKRSWWYYAAILCLVSETGSPITSTCVGLGNELYPDSGVAGKPVPGFNGQSFCDIWTLFCSIHKRNFVCDGGDMSPPLLKVVVTVTTSF